MKSIKMISRAGILRKRLADTYPWVKSPFVVSAPMRVMAGPKLAFSVSLAGGLGFIGPGPAQSTLDDLRETKSLVAEGGHGGFALAGDADADLLPVGVGFQTWNGDLAVAAAAVAEYRPAAVWLFAPREGQKELDSWTTRLREASPRTKIWIQVGTLKEAVAAAQSSSAPDVLVIQGAEAGGHGREADGIGFITLLPEVADAISGCDIPLVAAGGVADGRGVAAALALGAAAAAMGTRFLAATEARISKGYQDEVVRATDGATATTRTQLYNYLRGTWDWPAQFSPRGLINKSWTDHVAGVPFEELQKRHDETSKLGDAGWGPEGRLATYAGANVGLIRSVKDAGAIVEEVRSEARDIIHSLQSL